MKMPPAMGGSHSFAQVPRATIQRSTFNRSHAYKTTFEAGLLIPIYVDEALPGDTFNLSLSAFARLATPIKPIMDNLYFETFFFAVPYRLVWSNWEKFNGAQVNPGDSTSYVLPQMTAFTPSSGDLSDYFGLPLKSIAPTSLWHRAYNLIFNQWFRDQNLIPSAVVDMDDGPDSSADYIPRRRGKRHDYFTSALPWPQKGTAVSLPLGTSAPLIVSGTGVPTFTNPAGTIVSRLETQVAGAGPNATSVDAVSGVGLWAVGDPLKWASPGLVADLSTATAATINQLRQAFQVQRLLERDARGGTRYTEVLKAHFGVTSPDARLQRPEYLGGGSTPIIVSPIAQNSSTDATTPQGNLSGIGTMSVNGGHGFTKSFTEHCLLLGICCVRADLTYQFGMHRMWSRSTRYDFYWPALAQIGEQTVLNKEIFTIGGGGGFATDNAAFGYQERYAEYRYKPSLVTGLFRSDAPGSLDIWHLSEEFLVTPVLNESFIEEDPPIDRVIAVPAEPHFLFDSFFRLTCARPMPVFGVPGMIDHF